MRALVVYESAFGNTEKIARAIGEGVSLWMTTNVAEVSAAPAETPDLDLLVVGGPTHAFSMSRPSTRREAAKNTEEGEPVSMDLGIREWFSRMQGPMNWQAVAFDTRFKKPRMMTGSAARAAERRLRQPGCRIAAPAESFFVSGTTGPLLDGELDRARRWGEHLGTLVRETASRA
jgi:hypothetical protein